ncbi:unnamed protein product, partial [Polarella glacialis]
PRASSFPEERLSDIEALKQARQGSKSSFDEGVREGGERNSILTSENDDVGMDDAVRAGSKESVTPSCIEDSDVSDESFEFADEARQTSASSDDEVSTADPDLPDQFPKLRISCHEEEDSFADDDFGRSVFQSTGLCSSLLKQLLVTAAADVDRTKQQCFLCASPPLVSQLAVASTECQLADRSGECSGQSLEAGASLGGGLDGARGDDSALRWQRLPGKQHGPQGLCLQLHGFSSSGDDDDGRGGEVEAPEEGKRVTVWGLFQPRSHVKTALAGAGGGGGPGPVGVTLALLASSATWWRNPPEAMSDTSDASELAPEAVDPIEPDRFGLRWQGASHGSPGGASAWLLTLPAAGRIILLTSEGVIEGGVALSGRGVTGGRAITLDSSTVRTHPPRLFERLNGTEGKVHLCRSLPCTRLHLSSDTGNYRSPLVHATAFARCPESDPASQLDLGAVWTECRTGDPTPALLDVSIETALPPVADAVEGATPAEEERPPTPRMSWFMDHAFDTTAAQAWYSKVAAKLKWTSQVPQGDHDAQIMRHLSAPKVAFSVLAVVCLVAYSSLFPGPVPGGVLGSALYYAAKTAIIVASWMWHLGATFVGPFVSSLVIGSVGAWCAMSSGIITVISVGSAVIVNVFSKAASAAGHAFGASAGSAGGGAGASSSSGSVPPSGSAGGQAPGGARPGIATTPGPAPAGGSRPCGAPGVKWSTEVGPQQLAQWCASKSTELLPLLRVDAEQFVPPPGCSPVVDGCVGVCRLHHKVYKQTRWNSKCVFPETCLELGRPVKEYLLPGSPTVGMICMTHVVSALRTQDTLPEWVLRVRASVKDATSLQAACDGADGRPGLEGIVADLADEWNMRLAAAWERVASQCPHEWVHQLASRFGDTPVPRGDAPAPPPLLRSEAPVWSPFAGPEKHSGLGFGGIAGGSEGEWQPPPASRDLTSRSMFHGSIIPQDDAPQHPRLAGMMGLYGSGTVPLGPQDHSWNPVPQAGSMPPSKQAWDPYRDPHGLASLGGGSIYHPPPVANRGMSSNPMMSGTPVMTGGLASFGIHPGGMAPHGSTPWPQGQMGSSQSPPWAPGSNQNSHDPMHGLASAIGSLQQVLSKGNDDVVRQLERSNRTDAARGGDRHTLSGITREDELLKFAVGGCDTQPIALCPGETGTNWIRSMRTAVLERRSDLIKVDCPVKIDFYVARAVALCSWGIPEDGESPKVYLDAKDFPALGADELQRWRAPPVSDSVLRASGRDPLTIETWAECCGRLAFFFGLVYGRHHEQSIVECIAALRRKHNSDSRTWSFLVVQRIFSNLLRRYLTEWRQIIRNVIRMSGHEDPNKGHIRRICQTLGPDGTPVVQPPKVFDLEDPEGHFQKAIYARMQRNVHQALWANAYELGNSKPGARIGGDAAYPQGPKVAPQITRLATKHTDVGKSGLKKCWKFNSHMGCPDGKAKAKAKAKAAATPNPAQVAAAAAAAATAAAAAKAKAKAKAKAVAKAEGRVYPPAGIAPVSQAPQGFNYAPSSRGEGRLGRARVLRRPAVPTPKEHLFLARPVAHQWSQSQGPHARLTKHGAPQPVVSSLECLLPIGTLLLNRLPKGRWRQVQLEPIQTLGAKVQLQPFRAGNRSALVAQRHLVTSWLLLVMLSRLSAWQCNSRA